MVKHEIDVKTIHETIREWCRRHDVQPFVPIPEDLLVGRYLSKVADVHEFQGKTILEIGAGRSSYARLFLKAGCKRYYANDLVPSRIDALGIEDARFVSVPGDFLSVQLQEQVDVIFASLVMMFVVPLHAEFIAKMASVLKSGGVVMTMDANYYCPLSVIRRFMLDIGANPARVFSPRAYARKFVEQGFVIERLIPFTGRITFGTGNWLLGTTFWLRARKI